MIKINQYFHEGKRSLKGSISITGKLEAFVGKYYVSGEDLEDKIYTIYYDSKVGMYDAVDDIKGNLVAYMTADYEYAFVKESMLRKFREDTLEYNITLIPVNNFDDEDLCIDLDSLPKFMSEILWINDDFLSNENIDFDFDAFELIDSGIIYLNPNHFSVNELIGAIQYAEERRKM